MTSSEETFGRVCVRLPAKLEFQAIDTLHYHILLFLKSFVIEDVNQIDSMVSAELPSEQRDLRTLNSSQAI